MPQKFDTAKYKIADDMPERFAQVIPGFGIQHFSKANLLDNDLKALVKAKSKYVTDLESDEKTQPKEAEVKPSYKDIGKGKFPS